MSLLFQLISWPMFGIALFVFGFAPGAVLRVIVLAFPRGDPRRQELLAEVYAVPLVERPFWVAQQLEVALFEGTRGRLAARRLRASRKENRVAFFLPNDTRFLVTENGAYKASKHLDEGGGWQPVRFAIARPALDEMASDPRFADLPRGSRKLVLKHLANQRDPSLPSHAMKYWARARTMPCPICGADGLCGAEEVCGTDDRYNP
jgi:hypothetical protein